jgi:hypothetical protein
VGRQYEETKVRSNKSMGSGWRMWAAAAVLGLQALCGSAVWAQAVSSLQLVPNTVGGGSGGTTTAILTLAAPAPSGGATVLLESSNAELAASAAQVVVPAGQTQGSAIIYTNALYRAYSGQAFSAAISARNASVGAAQSATLNVTAQVRSAPNVPNPDNDRSGPVCAGQAGLLYSCPSGLNVQCTFSQECANGCQTRQAQGTSWRDQCAAAGPYPVLTNPKRIVGGNPGGASLQLQSAAPAGSFGLVASSSLVAAAQTRTQITIAPGATSLAVPLLTAPVSGLQFAPIDGVVTTPQAISGGGIFYARRLGRAWVAVAPGAAPAPSIVRHQLDTPSVRGGTAAFGTTCINQLAPAADLGVVPLNISSSNPAVAPVQAASLIPGSDCLSYALQTLAVANTTTVLIQAQLGAQTVNTPLQVTATPAASFVTTVFFNPLQVSGGQTTVATFVLDGRAPSGGFLVSLSSSDPAALPVPASITIAAGTDRLDVPLLSNPVAADVFVTLTPSPRAPGLTPQTQVRAAAGTAVLSSLSFSPATIVGGGTSTGIVQFSAPVAAAAVVQLSSASSQASVPASVTVPQGASSASFVVTSTSVGANTVVTLSATLGSTTQLGLLTLTPGGGGGGLTAPSPTNPANDFRFNAGQIINFDWTDVAGAASYEIQIDNSSAFSLPLTLQQISTTSQWSSAVPSQRLYWRVRALNASGTAGPWSAVRQIRPR